MLRASLILKKMTKPTRKHWNTSSTGRHHQKQPYERIMTLVLLDAATAQLQTIQLKIDVASKFSECQLLIEQPDGLHIQWLTDFELKHEAAKAKVNNRPSQIRLGRLRPYRQNRLQSH